MCLIVFSWRPDNKIPFILLANRDEVYQRPALTLDFWQDNNSILGGRDLEAGGGWLAVSHSGKLAAVTNFREWPFTKAPRSRGELTSHYLSSDMPARTYLESIIPEAHQYSGFNLLLADREGLYYYSNRSENLSSFLSLKPGTYGLCNHLLDTPWPKLNNVKEHFSSLLSEKDISSEQFIQLMHNSEQPPDNLLPNTGIGLERERLLSSAFIASDNYGTRNTSLLTLNQSGTLHWTEQNYLAGGKPASRQQFAINTPLFE